MASMTRREAIQSAAALGAALAWPSFFARRERTRWNERRDLFPQGVASGDPTSDSVLLWTRSPPVGPSPTRRLEAEVAGDPAFDKVVARVDAELSADNDWTCRVLAAGLEPAREYWYRFTDEQGFGSRVGRTVTGPLDTDDRPVRFAFVSCQNVTMGASNAYRRMIWEDERAPEGDRLGFVLHLGDFVYEVVVYPEDRPQGYYDRRLRDVVRYAHGEKFHDFHLPTDVEDYRSLYRGYLTDPDIQDARARWPFVCLWDNHEFSWKGWQSQQNFGGVRPAQTRKLAANQAWFEYQPARVRRANAQRADSFTPPPVANVPIREFDEHGLGLEAGNLAAIESLKIFRALRWGRNVELILTDNRTFRSEPLCDRAEFTLFDTKPFPEFVSQNVTDILDGGRAFAGGNPPAAIRFGGVDIPNPRKSSPPESMIGAPQKAWFFERLRSSAAPWKLWGNTVGMLDWRTDLQNLPPELGVPWRDSGYALINVGDWSLYRHERAEILDFVKNNGITGFVSLAGDRHAFTAGVLSKSLPPAAFAPAGAEFITGSISAPGLFEAHKHNIAKDHPLRAIYLYDPAPGAEPEPAINLSLLHGVRASLALARTKDRGQALAAANPEVAPHLSFADLGGHGYSVVRASADALEVEFVCVPRPLERSASPDGGPLAYRIVHRVDKWAAGAAPRVERRSKEGDLPLIL
jgi:alkaline phosphatase D